MVIGLWGFPGGWYETTYYPTVLEHLDSPEKFTSWRRSADPVRCRCTTFAIAKSFVDKGLDVNVVVYGLDTLAAIRPRINRESLSDPQSLDATLFNLVKEFLENDPKNYDEVKERSHRVLGCYAESYAKEVLGNGFVTRLRIEILPGVGTFSLGYVGSGGRIEKRYEFRGSPLVTYSALLLNILRYLIELKPDLVALDISHGMNYLPVLGRDAVSLATEVYASLSDKSVTLAILNSDPVSGPNQEAFIHLVGLRKYAPAPMRALMNVLNRIEDPKRVYSPLAPATPPQELQVIRKAVSKIYSDYQYILQSVRYAFDYGLVPYLHHIVTADLNVDKLRKSVTELEEYISKLIRFREVKSEADRVLIEQRWVLDPDVIHLLLALKLVKKVVDDLLHVFGEYGGLVEVEELRSLARRLGVSDVGRTLLDKECIRIKDSAKLLWKMLKDEDTAIKEVVLSLNKLYELTEKAVGKHVLKEVMSDGKEIGVKCPLNDDEAKNPHVKRNFYAHAGLQRKVVKVRIEEFNGDVKVFVGYINTCRDRLRELAKL